MKLFFCYILLMSIITFFLMFSDKRRAISHRWRISEKMLLFFSFLGGALGGLCGMFLFRHKTQHLSFRVLLPLFFLLHCILIVVFGG